jgi:hypothetical protein
MVLMQELAPHARGEGLDVGSAEHEIAAVQGFRREVDGPFESAAQPRSGR